MHLNLRTQIRHYLLFCGESRVTGRFPAQGPVMQSFDGFFAFRLGEIRTKSQVIGEMRYFDAHVTSI